MESEAVKAAIIVTNMTGMIAVPDYLQPLFGTRLFALSMV